jgi:hypothetical protein
MGVCWQAHFQLEGAEIIPLTAEGRVTVVILQLNDPASIAECQRLINIGLYS